MGIYIGGINGQRLAEVKSVSAHGLPGCGVYVLYLNLNILAANLKSEAFLSQVACRLELEEPNLKIENGFLEGRSVIRWTEYTDDSELGFFFYLSSSQVSTIEEYRSSIDLKLSIWLSGAVDYEGTTTDFIDKGNYVIPKQQWLEALSAMGYKDTLLFELPMPEDKNSENIQLKEILQRAQTHILNGHYQESIGLCRQAIELIEGLREDKKEASSAVAKYRDSRKEMNVAERMFFLREALKNITQLGAHNGDDFSRQQAQAVLGMTVSLLSAPEVGVLKWH